MEPTFEPLPDVPPAVPSEPATRAHIPRRYRDWCAGQESLLDVARGAEARAELAMLFPYLCTQVAQSASPERAMTNVARWLGAAPNQAGLVRTLAANPRAAEMIVTLFAGSQFLSGIFLRNPGYLDLFLRSGGRPAAVARAKSVPDFVGEARRALADCEAWVSGAPAPCDYNATLDTLRRYQQRESLRIGVADLCGLLDLSSVTLQLANLAEAMVRLALQLAGARTGIDPNGFIVLALGKLGGAELNYSSDIDLLFLATHDAVTYERLGKETIKVLTQATGEGFLYRVDMRLRPWGRVGPLVPTVEGYQSYLTQYARIWERQAMLKARAVAGNLAAGEAVLAWATALPFDASQEAVQAGIRDIKQLTEAELRQQGRDWGEVKLGEGSIRDVEFVTQYLQLIHGARHPEIRSGNTLHALGRLAEARLLPPDDHRVLVEGYIFLRTVEHYLQMLEYRQTNTLPAKPGELAYLAQRLGFSGEDAADRLVARYEQHSIAVRAIYLHYLGVMAMRTTTPADPSAENGVRRHLDRMSPAYTAAFDEAEIRAHAAMAERLSYDKPVDVVAVATDEGRWRVTIVGYDYTGELSLICGLLFVHGFSIIDGHVHTYEAAPVAEAPELPRGRRRGREPEPVASRSPDSRAKIVDVFTVRPVREEVPLDVWWHYASELAGLLRLLQAGQQREAQGRLAKSVALALRDMQSSSVALHPIDLEIDNQTSERYTILRIGTHDTPGFLYEFTNALALTGLSIRDVTVQSVGNRVQDTLWVADHGGGKLTSPERQRELRATVVLIKHFTHLLPQSPNPQAALLHFHAYLGELLRQNDWPDQLASLERPEVLQAMAKLLGVSDFLWEDFLRMQYANLFPVVQNLDALAAAKGVSQLQSELDAALAATSDGAARRDALNAFKDREMFRVDMRYILGHLQDFQQFSAELTDLAEVVIRAAYALCDGELRARYGEPRLDDGSPSRLTICAQGKAGGRELGFASDIELMFVYGGNGMTAGPQAITTSEYYEKLVPAVVQAIRARREGIFEIDLQLRPYGSAGSLAVSLNAFRRYFAPVGAAWSYERQALIKLRPVAGDPALGEEIVGLRDQYVYESGPFDIAAMRAMRERQIRHLVTAGTFNAKFSLGALVDVEYLVQALQINHGGEDPRLRSTNTAEAMYALAEAGYLSPEDYAFLRRAHAFLWRLIEALRVVRGNAKDLTVPPVESEEFAFLARRLGYGNHLALLRSDLSDYTAGVRKLLSRL